jgi:ketosteroid isomerase-like protein
MRVVMHRGFPAVAALLACACAMPASSAPPAASASVHASADAAAIERLERRWLAAVAPGGDRSALEGILADDYIDTDWQGHVRGKAALIGATTTSDAAQRVSDLRVRTWGDAAVATGINHVHSPGKGWSVDVAFTDVFARIRGHWRAVASQETVQKRPAAGH